ncbi:MAG: hypothetical protein SAQ54_11180 [Oscillatoria sp. PMC 1050.18]|nr:hypothetical protein [Oscillatoria sp. PMC 1050.18]
MPLIFLLTFMLICNWFFSQALALIPLDLLDWLWLGIRWVILGFVCLILVWLLGGD